MKPLKLTFRPEPTKPNRHSDPPSAFAYDNAYLRAFQRISGPLYYIVCCNKTEMSKMFSQFGSLSRYIFNKTSQEGTLIWPDRMHGNWVDFPNPLPWILPDDKFTKASVSVGDFLFADFEELCRRNQWTKLFDWCTNDMVDQLQHDIQARLTLWDYWIVSGCWISN